MEEDPFSAYEREFGEFGLDILDLGQDTDSDDHLFYILDRKTGIPLFDHLPAAREMEELLRRLRGDRLHPAKEERPVMIHS